MQRNGKFDVIIAGAGPAGLSAAICLRNSGLSIALLEKETFPRKKVCGEGLTLDVINQLKWISDDLAKAFDAFPAKKSAGEIKLFSPKGDSVTIPLFVNGTRAKMYTSARTEFDFFLLNFLKKNSDTVILESTKALKVEFSGDAVTVLTNKGRFEGSILLRADGVSSIVSGCKTGIKEPAREYTLGIRAHFSGLSPLKENNPLEIYFMEDTLPGYFWIFHLGDDIANVGLGVGRERLRKEKESIKKVFERIIRSGSLKERFEIANRISSLQGHLIPMNGEKRSISENRILFLGDAAGLANPFSGEGIGNAIRSGRVAADHVLNCFKSNDFSASFNRSYDKDLYKRIGMEFFVAKKMLTISGTARRINFIVGGLGKTEKTQQHLNSALHNYSIKKRGRLAVLMIRIGGILMLHLINTMIRRNDG